MLFRRSSGSQGRGVGPASAWSRLGVSRTRFHHVTHRHRRPMTLCLTSHIQRHRMLRVFMRIVITSARCSVERISTASRHMVSPRM